MKAETLTQLLITFGPQASSLIRKLVDLWDKPELSKEEVLEILSLADKSYDTYIAEARARLNG